MGFERHLLPDPATYFESNGLKLTGPSSAKWKTTKCDFHDGSDSMRVNVQSGAWKCMNCGEGGGDVLAYEMKLTGAEFVEAAKAIGAWVDDGKAPVNQKPTPLPPRAALSVMGHEATLVAIEAARIAKGVVPTKDDLDRLLLAAGRITALVGAYA